MNLRLLLRASGVTVKDLEEALTSSRNMTRGAGEVAELVIAGLHHISPKLQSEMAKAIAAKSVMLAAKVKDGSEIMLREGKHARTVPAKAEVRRLPEKVKFEVVGVKKNR